MQLEDKKIYRIVVARSEELELNMVYAEVGDNDYEVFGAFSGMSGGGGLFHQNADGEITLSDDPGEFASRYNGDDVNKICQQLEKLRADFELYNDEGDMVGFSSMGLKFLRNGVVDDSGYVEVYSDGASEDFIYDIQDEWNLGFYKE